MLGVIVTGIAAPWSAAKIHDDADAADDILTKLMSPKSCILYVVYGESTLTNSQLFNNEIYKMKHFPHARSYICKMA